MPIIVPRLEDPASASADERDEHLMLLEAVRHALEVEWTETLAASEQAGDHDLHGYPSSVAYLKHRMRMAGGRANRYVKNARAALDHQATFSSWKHRMVSLDQVEMLFRAAERVPDEYPNAEPFLLEIVGDTPDETRRVIDYWTTSLERPGVGLDLETQPIRRRLDFSRRANGMVEGEFALTSTAGEMFVAVMDAMMPPPAVDDGRTATQRRHDGFEDMVNGFLAGGDAPEGGGERPHVNVMVDVDGLQGIPGGIHETEDGHVLGLETIRVWACDSSVNRIVWSGQSEILDVGRRTRVIPAATRRAVVARDRSCTWLGCTRSARWADVHHLKSWSDGGSTDLDNLCLLCRYHHTLIHLHEWDPSDVLETHFRKPAAAGATGRST